MTDGNRTPTRRKTTAEPHPAPASSRQPGGRRIRDPTNGRRGPGSRSAERAAAGRLARQNAPRTTHGALELAKGRDPVAIILAQEADRLQDLLPLRHGRMADSAFAFYRGAPAVMAFDLSTTPRSDIIVQASGDAHLSNFGLFASPERTLVFDSNDFDETIPGPWEWDVKRLAASIVIACRTQRLQRPPKRGRP